MRAEREGRTDKERRLPIAEARANRSPVTLARRRRPVPTFLGVRAFTNYPLAELVERIDWTPFFATWELRGAYPAILSDPRLGATASDLFRDAQALLARIVAEDLLEAQAVVGFWPANATPDDDLVLFADASRTRELGRIHALRQQMAKPDGRPNLSLADWVAPGGRPRPRRHVRRHGGPSASRSSSREFEAAHDDYSAILATALADRLAEALAERMHERVRRELWGYAPDETLSNEDLIAERYQGIRPAPGYPATPDHLEKRMLFDLLDAEAGAGIQLTESMAMLPAASVSGLYLWHPDSHYFGIGRIGPRPARGLRPALRPAAGRGRPLALPEPRGRRPAVASELPRVRLPRFGILDALPGPDRAPSFALAHSPCPGSAPCARRTNGRIVGWPVRQAPDPSIDTSLAERPVRSAPDPSQAAPVGALSARRDGPAAARTVTAGDARDAGTRFALASYPATSDDRPRRPAPPPPTPRRRAARARDPAGAAGLRRGHGHDRANERSAPPPPPERAGPSLRLNLARGGDYVRQFTFVQCVGASVQMMLNMMEPGADRTRTDAAPPPGTGARDERPAAGRPHPLGRGRVRLGGCPQHERRRPVRRRPGGHARRGDAHRRASDRQAPAPGRPPRLAGPPRVGDERLRGDGDPRTGDFRVTRAYVHDPLHPYGSTVVGPQPGPGRRDPGPRRRPPVRSPPDAQPIGTASPG